MRQRAVRGIEESLINEILTHTHRYSNAGAKHTHTQKHTDTQAHTHTHTCTHTHAHTHTYTHTHTHRKPFFIHRLAFFLVMTESQYAGAPILTHVIPVDFTNNVSIMLPADHRSHHRCHQTRYKLLIKFWELVSPLETQWKKPLKPWVLSAYASCRAIVETHYENRILFHIYCIWNCSVTNSLFLTLISATALFSLCSALATCGYGVLFIHNKRT